MNNMYLSKGVDIAYDYHYYQMMLRMNNLFIKPFPGPKRSRGVTLTTHPHLVPRSRISMSYTCSPP
jgi:hypothetical protein